MSLLTNFFFAVSPNANFSYLCTTLKCVDISAGVGTKHKTIREIAHTRIRHTSYVLRRIIPCYSLNYEPNYGQMWLHFSESQWKSYRKMYEVLCIRVRMFVCSLLLVTALFVFERTKHKPRAICAVI